MSKIDDCIRYLNDIAMQIVDGMVNDLTSEIIHLQTSTFNIYTIQSFYFEVNFQLFISAKKLIHRDLAARNILLSSDNRAMVCIIYLVNVL